MTLKQFAKACAIQQELKELRKYVEDYENKEDYDVVEIYDYINAASEELEQDIFNTVKKYIKKLEKEFKEL